MKHISVVLIVGVLLTLTSCSDKVIAPRYTHVEKMLDVKPGMELSVVKSTLGCDPYDMYVDEQTGKSVYTWNYKHNERYVSSRLLDKKDGATVGDDRVKDMSTVYCIFSEAYILESISTSAGRADAVKLILFDNTFREAASDYKKYNSFELSKQKIEITDMSEKKAGGLGGLFGKKK
ncbi:MAG: hypothetical protein ACI9CU_002548 [Polaribacter sp.]|jgi:hypothetical protein